MLKSMNTVIMLVILCGELQSSSGEKLKCQFFNQQFPVVGTLYSCKVTSLDNSFNNITIDGYTGTHLANKTDKDVKGIFIHGTNTKYIPHGLGYMFNLLGLAIHKSQLVEIKVDNFFGMQNLEYLDLYKNNLTSVPSDAFSMIPKLKFINLNNNQIQYIGSGAFDQLKNLNEVYLLGNICVNNYYKGLTAITQMKEDLKVFCVEPISTSTTTTRTTTTTQNPMEVATSSEELQKEKSENLKVKIERDALATEKGVWIKDRDALVMELSNKTSENIELKTNCKQPIEAVEALDDLKMMMKQLLKESKVHQMECQNIIKLRAELSLAKETMKKTINDLNKEVMELKSQSQLERNTYMGLRTKLMETKEQLTTCKINERSLI